jgi:hypothetical protein
MAMVVAGPYADHRDRRLKYLQRTALDPSLAPMVWDLEYVDTCRQLPGCRKPSVDGILGISGQQCLESPTPQEYHEAVGILVIGSKICRRPQHLQTGPTEGESITLGERASHVSR